MSVEEELREQVERARDRFDKLVAGNMAIVAALLAIVSVLGQHFNTERILKQQESSDRWAYYQAKNIRRYIAQSTADVLTSQNHQAANAEQYKKDAARYDAEQKTIQAEARSLEQERNENGEKAHVFHFGEVLLEVAIVLLSLSILVKRRPLAYAGFFSALAGAIWAGTAFLH